MVQRILEITGLAALAPLGQSGPARSLLGPDPAIDGVLRLVVAMTQATVPGADGVSVSLRRRDRLSTVAASDQTILDMDAAQYSTGQGPCVDASVEGRWVLADSLHTETRWASFTPKAQALGINAILSSPLLAQNRPVGALNIYSRTAGSFGPKDRRLASMFAAEASVVLTAAEKHPAPLFADGLDE
jgi:GAF domain-containing protein